MPSSLPPRGGTDGASFLWNNPQAAVGPLAGPLSRRRRQPAQRSEDVQHQDIPPLGDTDVGELTTLEIQGWLAVLHRGHLSPNSVAKVYRLLKQILDGADDAGLIQANPCRLRGAGAERSEEMRIATPAEVQGIADAVDDRWRALILTAAYSGLRWGELTGLRRRDVDPAAGTITVTGQLSEVKGKIELDAPPKTAAGKRTVTLPAVVARGLVDHLARFTEPGSSSLVFTAPTGEPLRRSNFRRRVWYPAVEEVGLEGLRFHDLRHTGATLAAATGAPLRALMARLGHSRRPPRSATSTSSPARTPTSPPTSTASPARPSTEKRRHDPHLPWSRSV